MHYFEKEVHNDAKSIIMDFFFKNGFSRCYLSFQHKFLNRTPKFLRQLSLYKP